MSFLDTRPETRVANGAAWMDENHPGWERKIDLTDFDVDNPFTCVLGQNGISYAEIRRSLDFKWSVTHGFCNDFVVHDAWVALIKERFDTGNLSDL